MKLLLLKLFYIYLILYLYQYFMKINNTIKIQIVVLIWKSEVKI